jgi:site-specific recombinase XerC
VLKAPLSPLMSIDNLVAAVKRLEAQRPLTGKHEETIWGRDVLLLALLISNPLRTRNLRELTYRSNGTGHLRKTAQGEWRIVIHRQDFLNPWEGRNYNMRVDRSVWPYIERYLTGYRPVLVGYRQELVFASSSTPERAWWGLNERMKALTRRNLRCPGVGPHAIRHNVASSIIEKTGDIRLAAAILHDSPAAMKKHYSRLLMKFESCRAPRAERGRAESMAGGAAATGNNRPTAAGHCPDRISPKLPFIGCGTLRAEWVHTFVFLLQSR